MWAKFADVINCAKLHLHWLSRFGAPRVRKSPFPIDLRYRSYNSVRTNVLHYEKGNRNLTENYRLVSLTSQICKMSEYILALKLTSHGIGGKIYDWLVEWLSGRCQRVCLHGSLSSWLVVLSGVPQGSLLGPILFLIYISDLDIGIKNSLLKFADDTKVFGKLFDPADHFLLQDDVNHLIEWSTDWQMLFNVDKSKVMHFGKKNQEYAYYMNNHKLASITAEKDLGIWISHDLKAS